MILWLIMFSVFAELGDNQSGPAVSSYKSCPHIINELYQYESQDGLLFRSRQQDCVKNHQKAMQNLSGKNSFANAYQLQQTFQNLYPGFSKRIHNSAKSCAALNDKEKAKYYVAKQYYSIARIENTQKQLLMEMHAIRNLGIDNTEVIDCVGTKNTESLCKKLENQCSRSEKGLEQLVKDVRAVMALKQNIQRELGILSSKMFGAGLTTDEKEKLETLENAIKTIDENYPILKGKLFQESLKKKEGIEEAIKKQVKANLNATREMYDENKIAIECIAGSRRGTECKRKNISKQINKNPPLPDISYGEREKNLAAVQLSVQQCAVNAREDWKETGSTLAMAGGEALLLLTPLGLAGNAVLKGVRGARGFNKIKAAARSGRGAQTSRMERLARGGVYFSDSLWALYQVNRASDKCNPYLDGLEEAVKSKDNICSDYGSRNAQLKRAHAMCHVEIALHAVAPAMPALARIPLPKPSALKLSRANKGRNNMDLLRKTASMSDGERIRAAERIVGSPLSNAQKNALIRAHNLDISKISEKARILREAGFTNRQREVFMRSGLTGNVDTLKMNAQSLEVQGTKAFKAGEAEDGVLFSREAAESMEEFYKIKGSSPSGPNDLEDMFRWNMNGGNSDKASKYLLEMGEAPEIASRLESEKSALIRAIKKANEAGNPSSGYERKLELLKETTKSLSDKIFHDPTKRQLQRIYSH